VKPDGVALLRYKRVKSDEACRVYNIEREREREREKERERERGIKVEAVEIMLKVLGGECCAEVCTRDVEGEGGAEDGGGCRG